MVIHFEAVGVFHGERRYRYETPRQGVLARDAGGVIEFAPHRNFEQALEGLEQFERLWIVYVFHRNTGWRPKVRVPRHRSDKVGVFATRAPYRPNPIGLSCVRVEGRDGLLLRVSECDLLDGTPVLDVKPYLPYADSFPDAGTAWVRDALDEQYDLRLDSAAETEIAWIRAEAGINLAGFIDVQLRHDPHNTRRKRITAAPGLYGLTDATHAIAYRTWRIVYHIDEPARLVTVLGVRSGYTAAELAPDADDPYADKQLHRAFIAWRGE